ncbi:MAG: thiamine pyrophosphate-binding protein [Chloroflexi bacterium]|nr:thiamine pyrophosphate-binding protein [Chloroflexota bacterium]
MPRLLGKYALLEMLIAEGVRYIFGNPGTTETPLMDALQDYPQIQYILALQENSAVGMADGFARASGTPSFASLHIAGGLAGGMSMLYNAYRGGTPLVLTAGQSDTRMLLSQPVLSGDLVQMVHQYTKWSAQVHHASELPTAVRRAFKEAKTPPTGPVFLSLPWNVLDEEADVEIVPSSQGYYRIRPDQAAVEKAAQLLAQSFNPIMVVGDRVAQSGALLEAVAVAELLGSRVYASAFSEVNFPTSHPQYMGTLNLDSSASRKLLQEADVLLAVGANLFSTFIYNSEPFLGPDTKVIHLDSSTWEMEKVHATHVGIIADPKAGLTDLAQSLGQALSASARQAAKSRAALLEEDKKRTREAFRRQVKESWNRKPMSPERMMTELAQALPKEAIVADESITCSEALMGAMDFDESGALFTLRGDALGWGMPGSLGIKLASPQRPVVAIVGDGSAMYTVQSLWTAARYNIPVTYVICNNGTYKLLKANMDIYLREMLKDTARQSKYVGMDFVLPLDLARIAEAVGVSGQRIENPADLGPALKRAISLGKPALLDVVVDGS